MKRILKAFVIIVLAAQPSKAEDLGSPKAIADGVLQMMVSTSPIVGSGLGDVFEKEYQAHLCTAALRSNDLRLKALVAINALREMPVLRKPADPPISEGERARILKENPDYRALVKWYFDLMKEEREIKQ